MPCEFIYKVGNSRVVVVVFCFQIHHFKRCVYAAVLSETIVVLGGYWGANKVLTHGLGGNLLTQALTK